MPELTVPLISTSVINQLRGIGEKVNKVFTPIKKAFTKQN